MKRNSYANHFPYFAVNFDVFLTSKRFALRYPELVSVTSVNICFVLLFMIFFFVVAVFCHPFGGSLWSAKKKKKRFVSKNSGSATYRFSVPGDGCGTEPVAGKQSFGHGNVLIIRTETNAQARENSHDVQCLFLPGLPTSQLLDSKALLIEVDVENEELPDIRTQVLVGGIAVDQNTRIKIGDHLTFVFHVHEDYMDMFIKNCIASDGLTNRIQLTDSYGCPLRPKLMQAFKRVDNTLHARMTAFRIAETSTLSLTCEVELCREMCSNLTACRMQPAPPILATTTNTTIAGTSPEKSVISSVQLPFTSTSPVSAILAISSQHET